MGDTDRVRVPTNGHRPALDAAGDADATSADQGRTDEPAGPTAQPDLRIAVTPGQLAAGFGILAGLILLVVGSRRRGERRDRKG